MRLKKLLFSLSIALLLSCSNSDGDDPIPPNPQPTDDGKPTAVNDSKTMIEDSQLVLSDLLSNDSLLDNAKITSFDPTSAENGTIVDNRDGSYTYTPAKSFVGTDSFKYTICDDDDPTPNCSTATVTITVEDEGVPSTANDLFDSVEDTQIILRDFLENDTLTDDADISAIDNSNTQGTAELNEDGTITYTPVPGYVGEDTLIYTICDDDSPNPSCVSGTITITIHEKLDQNIPAGLSTYYETLGITTIKALNLAQVASHTSTKHSSILSYTERHNYLYNSDADLIKKDSVVLMYSGELRYWEEYGSGSNSYSPQTFNTEHVYPQSKLISDLAITDLHHLRVCDSNVNSDRSNYPFTSGSGDYTLNDNTWYPGDEWRGDVARMIMYLHVRYGEKFDRVGTLELFLQWNIDDPVSAFEIQRNDVIEGAQGNRNPFIDNPYLATLIWGGEPAENKWK